MFILNYSTVFSIVLILLIVSFLLSAGLMIYSLRIHSNKAANAFGILMLVISLWVLFKIISLFIFSVEIREFLHKINILIIVLITPLLLIVSIYHTTIPKWFRKKHIVWLSVFPAFIYLLVFISPYKNYLFYGFEIIENYGIPIHIFKKKLLYLILDIYNYLLILSTLIILIKSL